jgi:hypothetical protein
MLLSEGPAEETLGEFEIRLDQWLKAVAAEMPDLPQEALDWSRDAARRERLYRNTDWE